MVSIYRVYKNKRSEHCCFCDIDIDKAQAAAKEYGTENAKVYEDYQSLLKDDAIDVIHVCTPNSSHKELTVASLDAGKHVMCENLWLRRQKKRKK